ncbi:MAG TPA: SRPBCC family protein, partial [Limnobacter sp.]|nr:SRPBCC family protein [Limnobacter sp.]
MAIWFDLDKVTDESFFDNAPIRFAYSMHLDATADEVWAGLVADKPLAWCKALDGLYSSARPFGVGTTRNMGASFNLIQLRERFFIWDEAQRRHAFYVEQANAPTFKQFAEYYEVSPAAQGCIFVWKFAMVGRTGLGLPLRLISPLAKRALFDG